MAWKHRKLFPTNQTQDCSGFCDPACPYNCYNYPDYYYSPPPPPSSSSSISSGSINHISSYLIILVSLFTVIFVVVGFYVIKLKCYADWCGFRAAGSVPSQSSNNSEEDEFLNENQLDHPVWLIATVGLHQSIINSITICKYRKDEGLVEGTECSVCLNEFREGETLRLLPKCNHAFHIPCIDTWLRSHTNCPLCRAGIVSNNNGGAAIASEAAAASNLDSMQRDNANLGRRNQEIRNENENENGNNTRVHDDDGLRNNTVTNVNFDSCHVTQVLSDQQIEDSGVQNDRHEIQTEIIRPVSSEICVIDHNIEDEKELHMVISTFRNQDGDDNDDSKTSKTTRRSSIEECLHISPVSMKRSFSCSGRILCTRGYMSRNSTLRY